MKDKKKEKESKKNAKNRGSADDLQILSEIISENISIKMKILDQIRQVRAKKEAKEKRQGSIKK
jgi:hypothetical protein